MADWPLLRTDKSVSRAAGYNPLAYGAIVVVIVPFVVGLLSLGAGIALSTLGAPEILPSILGSIGLLLAYSPLIVLPSLLIVLPVAWIALTQGLGGWLSAVVAGAITVGLGLCWFTASAGFDTFAVGAATGALYAALFWIGVRRRFPDVIVPPE